MKEILQNEGVFTKNCKKHIAADIEEGEDICTRSRLRSKN